MLRLLRMAVLPAIAAFGLAFGAASSASAHDWLLPPARVHVHRYGYGPVFRPRVLPGRSFSLYVSPGLSVYGGAAYGPSVGVYAGPVPGFYPRPYAYGYNYYHGPSDYSYQYGW